MNRIADIASVAARLVLLAAIFPFAIPSPSALAQATVLRPSDFSIQRSPIPRPAELEPDLQPPPETDTMLGPIERFQFPTDRQQPSVTSLARHTTRLRIPQHWESLAGERSWIVSRSAQFGVSNRFVGETSSTVVRQVAPEPRPPYCPQPAEGLYFDVYDISGLQGGYAYAWSEVRPLNVGESTVDHFRVRPKEIGIGWRFAYYSRRDICESAYSLSVDVNGPAAIDPVTGQRLSAPAPVN